MIKIFFCCFFNNLKTLQKKNCTSKFEKNLKLVKGRCNFLLKWFFFGGCWIGRPTKENHISSVVTLPVVILHFFPQIRELEDQRREAEEERERAEKEARLRREQEIMRLSLTQDKEVKLKKINRKLLIVRMNIDVILTFYWSIKICGFSMVICIVWRDLFRHFEELQ